MRLLCCVVMCAAGCDYVFLGKQPIDAAIPPDAPIPPDARTCLGTGILTFCIDGTLSPVTLAGPIDTASDTRCQLVSQIGGPQLCVIGGTTITTGDNIAVRGTFPLVLAATTSIVVSTSIDAASRRANKTGPGARLICGVSGNGGNGTTAGAGGAGGTFGFRGGPGAAGQGGASTSNPAPLVEPLVFVVGGCPGYLAGRPSGVRAPGGDGGGAIALVAGQRITIEASGSINASGAGGGAGPLQPTGGGGGGGAGGLILLDAPTVTIDGPVFARGGGGGGGGGTTAAGATAGTGGNEATNVTGGGGGGAGGIVGGGPGAPGCGGPNGAEGGFPTTNPAVAGGGGGGGGCGVIRIYGARSVNVATSPAVTP
jgi:hypothetical protein